MCIFRCQKYCGKASRSRSTTSPTLGPRCSLRRHNPPPPFPSPRLPFPPNTSNNIYMCEQQILYNQVGQLTRLSNCMRHCTNASICMVSVVLVNGFNYSKTVITSCHILFALAGAQHPECHRCASRVKRIYFNSLFFFSFFVLCRPRMRLRGQTKFAAVRQNTNARWCCCRDFFFPKTKLSHSSLLHMRRDSHHRNLFLTISFSKNIQIGETINLRVRCG